MKLKVGKKAPDFTLIDHLEREISLHNYRGKNIVLFFFPRAWTPI